MMTTPETQERIVQGLLKAIADAECAGNSHLSQQYRDSLQYMLFMLGNNHPTDDLQ